MNKKKETKGFKETVSLFFQSENAAITLIRMAVDLQILRTMHYGYSNNA